MDAYERDQQFTSIPKQQQSPVKIMLSNVQPHQGRPILFQKDQMDRLNSRQKRQVFLQGQIKFQQDPLYSDQQPNFKQHIQLQKKNLEQLIHALESKKKQTDQMHQQLRLKYNNMQNNNEMAEIQQNKPQPLQSKSEQTALIPNFQQQAQQQYQTPSRQSYEMPMGNEHNYDRPVDEQSAFQQQGQVVEQAKQPSQQQYMQHYGTPARQNLYNVNNENIPPNFSDNQLSQKTFSDNQLNQLVDQQQQQQQVFSNNQLNLNGGGLLQETSNYPGMDQINRDQFYTKQFRIQNPQMTPAKMNNRSPARTPLDVMTLPQQRFFTCLINQPSTGGTIEKDRYQQRIKEASRFQDRQFLTELRKQSEHNVRNNFSQSINRFNPQQLQAMQSQTNILHHNDQLQKNESPVRPQNNNFLAHQLFGNLPLQSNSQIEMQSKQAREDLKAILDLQVKQKEVKILDGSDIYNRNFTSTVKNISPSKLLKRKFDEIYTTHTDRIPVPENGSSNAGSGSQAIVGQINSPSFQVQGSTPQRQISTISQQQQQDVNLVNKREQANQQNMQAINQSKVFMDHLTPAGLFNNNRKPPLEWRFDDGMPYIRNHNQTHNYLNLQRQNRMFALLQQNDGVDQSVKNGLLQGQQIEGNNVNLQHTDFEGYRAISKETINQIPKDYQGLKNVVTPQKFVSPLRDRFNNNQPQYKSQMQLQLPQIIMPPRDMRQNVYTPMGKRNETLISDKFATPQAGKSPSLEMFQQVRRSNQNLEPLQHNI